MNVYTKDSRPTWIKIGSLDPLFHIVNILNFTNDFEIKFNVSYHIYSCVHTWTCHGTGFYVPTCLSSASLDGFSQVWMHIKLYADELWQQTPSKYNFIFIFHHLFINKFKSGWSSSTVRWYNSSRPNALSTHLFFFLTEEYSTSILSVGLISEIRMSNPKY